MLSLKSTNCDGSTQLEYGNIVVETKANPPQILLDIAMAGQSLGHIVGDGLDFESVHLSRDVWHHPPGPSYLRRMGP